MFTLRRHATLGFTLIEILVSLAIVAVMASVASPLLQVTVQRQKEQVLREQLRELRHAIDAYKKATDEGRIKKSADASGYPPNLQVLVEGEEDQKDTKRKKLKFLRRIPIDPTLPKVRNNEASQGWGLRSFDSSADQPRYVQDVYDVYSLSTAKGLNGVPYAQW